VIAKLQDHPNRKLLLQFYKNTGSTIKISIKAYSFNEKKDLPAQLLALNLQPAYRSL
jgi:hypothetical protein